MIDIEQQVWGMTENGEPVILYTITNTQGNYVKVTNLGASIVAIGVADRDGVVEDVALGYDTWGDYLNDDASMGKSLGRYANRIARGRFQLGGQNCQLPINLRPHHINGGATGFGNQIWQGRFEGDRIVFSYVSAPLHEGYPGELGVEVVYDWNQENELEITYFAGTDSLTVVNLTNHLYLNLDGHGAGSVLDHTLEVRGSEFLETDASLIPTGRLLDTENTALDFRKAHRVGDRIDDSYLANCSGYDHCLVIDPAPISMEDLRTAAILRSEKSGRQVTVVTNQPAVQVYTGNFLSSAARGKGSVIYDDYAGLVLECGAYTDAVNHAEFPSTTLSEGELYVNYTTYKFSVQ